MPCCLSIILALHCFDSSSYMDCTIGTSLGVSHPDMRADPLQWVKDLKVARRKLKNSSQRTIESLRSATYY